MQHPYELEMLVKVLWQNALHVLISSAQFIATGPVSASNNWELVEMLAIISKLIAAHACPLALVAHASTKRVANILHLSFCSTVLTSGCPMLGLHW